MKAHSESNEIEAVPAHETATATVYGETDTGSSEPYTWERCTKVLTLRFLANEVPTNGGRLRVLIAGRTHLDEPVVSSVELSELEPLPAPIAAILDALRDALPRHAARRLEAVRAVEAKRTAEEAARKAADEKKRQTAAEAKLEKKEKAEAKVLNRDLKAELARARVATKAARTEASALAKQKKELERERTRFERERAKAAGAAPSAEAPSAPARVSKKRRSAGTPEAGTIAPEPLSQPELFGA